MPDDDPLHQVRALQAERRANRQSQLRRSRLDRYRQEIEQLRDHDVSYGDIALWLQAIKHVQVDRSSVYRKVQRWAASDHHQTRERDQLQARYDDLLE